MNPSTQGNALQTEIGSEKRKNASPIYDVKKHFEDIQLAIFSKGTCELRFGVDEKILPV